MNKLECKGIGYESLSDFDKQIVDCINKISELLNFRGNFSSIWESCFENGGAINIQISKRGSFGKNIGDANIILKIPTRKELAEGIESNDGIGCTELLNGFAIFEPVKEKE